MTTVVEQEVNEAKTDVEQKAPSEYSMAAPRQEPVSNQAVHLKPSNMTFGIPK